MKSGQPPEQQGLPNATNEASSIKSSGFVFSVRWHELVLAHCSQSAIFQRSQANSHCSMCEKKKTGLLSG